MTTDMAYKIGFFWTSGETHENCECQCDTRRRLQCTTWIKSSSDCSVWRNCCSASCYYHQICPFQSMPISACRICFKLKQAWPHYLGPRANDVGAMAWYGCLLQDTVRLILSRTCLHRLFLRKFWTHFRSCKCGFWPPVHDKDCFFPARAGEGSSSLLPPRSIEPN